MASANPSLAQDLFEDMGRKVAEASREGFGDGNSKVVEEIESLCMNCHDDGVTRLLLTRIPFFREIVIMSFSCPKCGFSNTEIQPAGEIQQRGARFALRADKSTDLNRQIVKSDTCTCKIEELDLEIPAGRGQLTNVEGLLAMVASDLEQKQDERKEVVPELWAKIEEIIKCLRAMASSESLPFTVTLDDPAGNSWIEPSPSDKGGKYSKHEYARTAEQNAALGLTVEADTTSTDETTTRPEYHAHAMVPELPPGVKTNNVDEEEIVENQVYSFPASCPGCTKPCVTNMKMVNIPHFKQVVLMSTVCEHCGYRSNEVKTGGEVPEKGRRITLEVRTSLDLGRDILKSESCAMNCPELSLAVEPGTMGGRFTTVEGLLTQVRDDLHSSIFDTNAPASEPIPPDAFTAGGDSMDAETRAKWAAFFGRLNSALKAETSFTVVLEDPLASSYVQSLVDDGRDEQIKVEDYDRTDEEEESLGLKDIKTEGYEESEARVEHEDGNKASW
ncbi:zinc finger protein-like protein zpr1 [Lineolata rhizophorae]|uniref:Zinc finger protein-like protein zpr1 n=1 Tax=Lineolata rhizophorae TaxID=578093 RepID=A0A6A6PBC9_9PEZI|nr:zinc finger protein-like protein zpr1 [Lineolata rhizophorae]